MKKVVALISILLLGNMRVCAEFENFISFTDRDGTQWHVDERGIVTSMDKDGYIYRYQKSGPLYIGQKEEGKTTEHFSALKPGRAGLKKTVSPTIPSAPKRPPFILDRQLFEAKTLHEVQSLVEEGAHLDAEYRGESLFDYAARTGNVDLLTYLMERDVSPLRSQLGADQKYLAFLEARRATPQEKMMLTELEEYVARWRKTIALREISAFRTAEGIIRYLKTQAQPIITVQDVIQYLKETRDLHPDSPLIQELKSFEQQQAAKESQQHTGSFFNRLRKYFSRDSETGA